MIKTNVKKAIKALKNKRTEKVATAKTTTNPKMTYRSIAENIYHNGFSYRVRVTVNGVRNSKNFTSKKAAIAWRNEIRKTI